MTRGQASRRSSLGRAAASMVAALAMVFVGVVPAAHAAPVVVTINVVDSDSNPLPNFEVVLNDAGSTTDASGSLTRSMEPGEHQLRANDISGMYPSNWHTFTVADSGAQTITVTLDPRYASVTGSVPADSVPLRVSLSKWAGSAWSHSETLFVVDASSGGQFEIPLSDGPGVYTLFFDVDHNSEYFNTWLGPGVNPGDHTNPDSAFTVAQVGEVYPLGAIELLKAATLSGVVYEDDGLTPIPDALVAAWAIGINRVDAVTGVDGSYSLSLHPGYEWSIEAAADGFGTMFLASGGGTAHYDLRDEISVASGASLGGRDFHLPALGTIEGTVYEADGTTPIHGAEVRAQRDEEFDGESTTTDQDGNYSLRVHPAHPWLLSAEASGFRGEYYDEVADVDFATPVSVSVGGTVGDIDFTLDSVGAFIIGAVMDAPSLDVDDPMELVALTDTTAHLFQRSGSDWSEVDSMELQNGTDLGFGDEVDDDLPLSLFWFPSWALEVDDDNELIEDAFVGLESGDYRIFFSKNGDWLPILAWAALGDRLGLEADDDDLYGEGFFCYLDASGLAAGNVELFITAVNSDQASGDCAPSVVNATPTPTPTPTPPPTPAPAPTPGPSAPGSGTTVSEGGVDNEVNGDDGETDEVEDPGAAQPTSPPATPTPSPTPDPSAEGVDAGDGPDLTWLWWTGGILLLIIIAGGTILVVRRP